VIASAIYALMLYPAWRARIWIPRPFGLLFFFTLLTFAALAASLRLHLWFTARFYPSELSLQRARASIWTRATDAGFSLALVAGALAIGGDHPEIATLFIAVAIAAAVAAWLIEPTTTRAAFSASRPSASPRA
jgi:Kef-type K+ transport system membrane component KefB